MSLSFRPLPRDPSSLSAYPCVAKDAGEIVIGGRPAVTEANLIARTEECEGKMKDVEGANPLLSHSEHLAVTRKLLVELDRLKAQLAKLDGDS